MNVVLEKDIQNFRKTFPLGEDFRDAKFLITGATGLIGSTLIYCLLSLNKKISILAPVRSKKKALLLFEELSSPFLEIIECDIANFDYVSLGKIDYIIHCAAPTASNFFVEQPLETFYSILNPSKTLLEYARNNEIKGFVYLSSIEVYGSILDDKIKISENNQGFIETMSVRSSYPMAKRTVENLCCLYAHEHSVPVKVARLTQTTGAGVTKDDNRVIVQFARHAFEGKDIILHTKGESARPYCYTIDSISAILYILLKGNSGKAYNVANEETYISVKEMAEYVKSNFNNNIKVSVKLNNNNGYAPVTKQRLSTSKLEELGWEPQFNLYSIFDRLIEYLKTL